MAETVRSKIIKHLNSKISALSWVEKVIDGGDLDETTKATDPEKCVVQLAAHPDETDNSEGNRLERLVMPIDLIVQLPSQKPETAFGAPQTWDELAAAICADLYLVHSEDAEAESMNGNAIECRLLMFCAGVLNDPHRGNITGHSFEIVYRFVRGNPTTAA